MGFDWPDREAVLNKVNEELNELLTEIDTNGEDHRLKDEVGDLHLAVSNLARHLGVDAETALRNSNDKFVRRFHRIEQVLADREIPFSDASLDEMEAIWVSAKSAERQDG